MNRGFERYADWDDYLHYLRNKDFFTNFDKSKVKEDCYQGDSRYVKEIEGAANFCFTAYAREHGGHLADEYTVERCAFERASNWLDENHEDPFFLVYSLYRPHGPLEVPEDVEGPSLEDLPPLEWDDQDLASTPSLRQRIAFMNSKNGNAYSAGLDLAKTFAEDPELSKDPGRSKEMNSYNGFRKDYYRSINYVDRYAGKMMDKLKALGHAEDTMIIFTSDHGDMLGEHGLNLKMCFYEASIRVPLLIHIPGNWETGERDDRPVMLLDLVPTIAGQFGIEIGDHLPGIDLRKDSYGHERPVFWEIVSSFAADIAQYGYENHVRMVKTDTWKYLHKAFGNHELYDMVSDPNENNNLGDHPDYQEVCATMKQLIDEHLGKFEVENIKVVM
jgi:arylsulfatase A-like enzyme